MNIQIFGTKKCNDTKKAERFFKERGIKYQFIDMKEKGMSKGEFNSVAQVNGGLENMINWEGKDKDLLALIKYIADEDKLEKVLENPQVIKTPVVRNGKQSTWLSAGYLERMELMVKKIVKDPLFLAQKSVDATEADKQVVTDLLDTLRANLDHCVGMAANMIGVKKNIIVVAAGPFQFAMINPVITKKSGAFQTEEGCLSLEGVRPCTRYQEIEVDYLDQGFKKQHGKYSGWTAQIIQHEIDHCNGIVI